MKTFINVKALCYGKVSGKITLNPPKKQDYKLICTGTNWVAHGDYMISEYGHKIEINDENYSWFKIKEE